MNVAETLKAIERVLEPDSRQKYFQYDDPQLGLIRPQLFEDIYREAASIQLSERVPLEIKSHFATALNLLIYSWFFYPFNVTAQFMAYVTVEKALQQKYPNQKRPNFSDLIRMAVRDGLIHEEHFSHLQAQAPGDRKAASVASAEHGPSAYVEALGSVLPKLRNSLAHGTSMLHPEGAQHVRFCAEFINQLFAA